MKQRYFLFNVILFVSLLFVLTGCGNQEPIKVGFAATLTGSQAQLGVDARDGAQLAVETINQSGGINGRSLQLIIKDDGGKPEIAKQVDGELRQQNVVAIIGHATSGQTAAVLDQINQAKIVLLSPTASSDQFTGKADYLFRVVSTTNARIKGLARYIYQTHQVRNLVIIYDEGNKAFSEPYWQGSKAAFEKLGGKADRTFPFTSGKTDLSALMNEIKATNPEAILFISSATDTALMMQYGRQLELKAKLFSSAWAQTNELLEKGGKAVEGLEMDAVYDAQSSYPSYQKFVTQFKSRYNRETTFPTSLGYEAVLVLAAALKQTNGQAGGLPEALIKIKDLEGAQGKISLDEFGDVQRDAYIVTVKDGQFKLVNTVPYQ